jgi:hypothetical protein
MVDFAGGLGRRGDGGLEDVVEGSSDVPAARGLGIGLAVVIDHLVLVTQNPVAAFEDEILHAAVPGRGDFPIPLQLEIVELGVADDIAAPFAQAMEPAVLDDPTFGGEGGFVKGAPTGGGVAVEEQFPAGGLLLWSERVLRSENC